jgi:hypothetical protein
MSQKRISALKQAVKHPIQGEVRLRQDIQAFISLTTAKNTRPVIPALRYYQVPWKLLATSKLLPSRKGLEVNEPDLNGLEVILPAYLLNDSPIQNGFEALGYDAYQLLGYSEVVQLAGQTGHLSTQQKQVYRQLDWHRFNKGQIANWRVNPPAQSPAPTQP